MIGIWTANESQGGGELSLNIMTPSNKLGAQMEKKQKKEKAS
jgi:hypothetical protein